MKQVIIAIIAITAIIGGAIVLGKDSNGTAGVASNNIYGNPDATVTLVEYGDFECPACGAFHPIVTQVKEQFKDQIKFEFRNYPLIQIHQNAQAAHRAAQAAANQGAFWEMHDKIYEQQRIWNSQATTNPAPIFEGYAQELGLDMERFNTDVAASTTLGTINADIAMGKDDGVSATPTFFLNGKKIEDTSTIDTAEKFSSVIAEALGQEVPSSINDNGNPNQTDEKQEETTVEPTE